MRQIKICFKCYRSSHRKCSVKKDVLRNFSKFTGEHPFQDLILIKLQASVCKFIKIEILAQVFSYKFFKISKNTFFTEHFRATASVPKVLDNYFATEQKRLHCQKNIQYQHELMLIVFCYQKKSFRFLISCL